MDEEVQTLVIDNGSATIKAGYAGYDSPVRIFSAVVGRPKFDAPVMVPLVGLTNGKGIYLGDEAQSRNGVLKLNSPIENGIISDWQSSGTTRSTTNCALPPRSTP